MAAHSRVIIEVLNQVQKRKKCASTGWKSTPRWAWLRCRYRVTAKMVSWVTSRKYRAMAPSPQPVRPDSSQLYRVADRSEEHTSELQSLMRISYAVFCLKKKKKNKYTH